MGIFDFLKKNKNVIDENGYNEIYFNNGKGKIMKRFSKRNGKLDGLSFYVDEGGNPVLFEWYEDGVLVEQMSGAHEAVDRGINYGPKCEPADGKAWRSCPTMGKE